jgi:hypothetical protein
MNRAALGLAVGAGYLLGRTKKLKMALAVGSLVAGKKLNVTPKALAGLVQQQLRDNPQVKEIGDQLRGDLKGVGKAASGAMVERQMTALADRLHGRTAQVRDQLSGAAPTGRSEDSEDSEDSDEGRDEEQYDDSAEESGEREDGDREDTGGEARKEAPRKKAAKKAVPKKTAKKAAAKAPAKKAAARRTGTAGRTGAKKTGATGGTSGRSGQPKGGDDR